MRDLIKRVDELLAEGVSESQELDLAFYKRGQSGTVALLRQMNSHTYLDDPTANAVKHASRGRPEFVEDLFDSIKRVARGAKVDDGTANVEVVRPVTKRQVRRAMIGATAMMINSEKYDFVGPGNLSWALGLLSGTHGDTLRKDAPDLYIKSVSATASRGPSLRVRFEVMEPGLNKGNTGAVAGFLHTMFAPRVTQGHKLLGFDDPTAKKVWAITSQTSAKMARNGRMYVKLGYGLIG